MNESFEQLPVLATLPDSKQSLRFICKQWMTYDPKYTILDGGDIISQTKINTYIYK